MVDDDRRRFLKHLGIVGAAGVIGLGIARFSSDAADATLDALEATEQARGNRRVWATYRDATDPRNLPYESYQKEAERLGVWECPSCGYIYDVTDGRVARFDELPASWVCTAPGCAGAAKDEFTELGIAFRPGGQPLINEVACAFHYDRNGDGKFEASEEQVFCTMPCKTVCPVTAISKKAFDGTPEDQWATVQPKLGPVVDFKVCIGCGRCHKICGYNCIEWVNEPYRDLPGGGGGG
jgi:rubredoxin